MWSEKADGVAVDGYVIIRYDCVNLYDNLESVYTHITPTIVALRCYSY
jgi:hypothetical protein